MAVKSKNMFLLAMSIFFVVVLSFDPSGTFSPTACGGEKKAKMKEAGAARGKADLPFFIDCEKIDPAKRGICQSYIEATRDRSYPILRDMTGTYLSRCYDAVYYTILPGDVRQGAGGVADRNRITYNQRYSIDLDHAWDQHELIHTISDCNGALDEHVFHGPLMNAVASRLGAREAGYFYGREEAVELNRYNFDVLGKPGQSDSQRRDTCRGILGNQVTILYFDLGEDATMSLYRGTIEPRPSAQPNAQLINHWGPAASQVQALLETVWYEYKYDFSVPACGFGAESKASKKKAKKSKKEASAPAVATTGNQ